MRQFCFFLLTIVFIIPSYSTVHDECQLAKRYTQDITISKQSGYLIEDSFLYLFYEVQNLLSGCYNFKVNFNNKSQKSMLSSVKVNLPQSSLEDKVILTIKIPVFDHFNLCYQKEGMVMKDRICEMQIELYEKDNESRVGWAEDKFIFTTLDEDDIYRRIQYYQNHPNRNATIPFAKISYIFFKYHSIYSDSMINYALDTINSNNANSTTLKHIEINTNQREFQLQLDLKTTNGKLLLNQTHYQNQSLQYSEFISSKSLHLSLPNYPSMHLFNFKFGKTYCLNQKLIQGEPIQTQSECQLFKQDPNNDSQFLFFQVSDPFSFIQEIELEYIRENRHQRKINQFFMLEFQPSNFIKYTLLSHYTLPTNQNSNQSPSLFEVFAERKLLLAGIVALMVVFFGSLFLYFKKNENLKILISRNDSQEKSLQIPTKFVDLEEPV